MHIYFILVYLILREKIFSKMSYVVIYWQLKIVCPFLVWNVAKNHFLQYLHIVNFEPFYLLHTSAKILPKIYSYFEINYTIWKVMILSTMSYVVIYWHLSNKDFIASFKLFPYIIYIELNWAIVIWSWFIESFQGR